MARGYAYILTAIWGDEDFCALSAGAQRTYFMLVTQADINACGTLALTLRRWSFTLPPRERRNMTRWLDELAAASFIVTDERTEELLVRTFVKHDGGYKNLKRLAAIHATAAVIRSPRIRQVLQAELAKLGLLNPDGSPIDRPPKGDQTPIDPPWVVVTKVGTDTTTLIPQPGGPSASDADDAEPPPWCSKHVGGTEEPCGPCGTAAKRNRKWHTDREKAAAEQRKRASMDRDACTLCDENGWLIDPDTSKPLSRCDHHRRTA